MSVDLIDLPEGNISLLMCLIRSSTYKLFDGQCKRMPTDFLIETRSEPASQDHCQNGKTFVFDSRTNLIKMSLTC